MMVNWDLMIAVLKNFQHIKHTFSEHHILSVSAFHGFHGFHGFSVRKSNFE